MSHLRSRVTALVDGELPAAEAEEALGHVVGCAECARLLAQERASRRALSQAQDAVPDDELTARLLALSLGPDGPLERRHRRGPLLAGAGVLSGVAVVGLVVVGGLVESRADPQTILGAVSGRTGTSPAELAGQVGTVETSDEVVAWMEEEGWSAPDSLPDGMRVVHVALHQTDGGDVLEVEIAGAMAHVRMLQQRGVLATDTVDGLQAQLVGSHDAVLLPTGTHHVALQSEECVVVVASAGDDVALSDELLDALPAGDYDTSLPARLARGWQTVTRWALD